eukprot:gene4202-5975_t
MKIIPITITNLVVTIFALTLISPTISSTSINHCITYSLTLFLSSELLHYISPVSASSNELVSKKVLQMQGDNFELALTSYKYIAILFYDNSELGSSMVENLENAVEDIPFSALPKDTEIAMISGSDPELKEIIDAYGLNVPCMRVFRRGIMSEYRGPYDPEGMSSYLIADAQPSIQAISTIKELGQVLGRNLNSVILGIFNEDEMSEDVIEGYSMDAWGQFQATADSLRGHASFFLVKSPEVISSFKLASSDLPVVYMVSSDGDGFIKYNGEILEINLSDWILRNFSPETAELTISTPNGEVYATQFFSSRKLKFILFISPQFPNINIIIQYWKELATIFQGKAIFSYMTQFSVADVVEYFDINTSSDIPLIAAHQPTTDSKFKSSKLIELANYDNNNNDEETIEFKSMKEFVAGVITGKISKVLKSEAVPTVNKGTVQKVVANNLIETVSNPDKDVMLLIYTPWCQLCKRIIPTYELLGKAVQSESRILVTKIDNVLNDIPISWIQSYRENNHNSNNNDYGTIFSTPIVLWFPKKDKPYEDNNNSNNIVIPTPRPYWDAGLSLQELMGFILRETSFNSKSLKVATTEQIGSLLGDEETYRMKYLEEEHHNKRNEGRIIFQNKYYDMLLGEVVFDGKRWHIGIVIGLGLSGVVLQSYGVFSNTHNRQFTPFTVPTKNVEG